MRRSISACSTELSRTSDSYRCASESITSIIARACEAHLVFALERSRHELHPEGLLAVHWGVEEVEQREEVI